MMLLTMPPNERANRLAFNACSRRVGDFGFRAAATRAALELVMLAIVLVSDAPMLNVFGIGLAMFGTYLSLSDNYYTEHRGQPRDPLARWSFGYAESGFGQFKPYISGIVEALAYVPLVLVGSWGMATSPDVARLTCLACAIAFIASCLGAIFVDAAFYNPDVRFPVVVELIRATAGFIAAVLSAAVALTAPWQGLSWWVAAALCASLVLVQIRIRETDRAFVAARGFADNEQLEGREAVTGMLHSMVGTPLTAVRQAVTRYRDDDPRLYDSFRVLEGSYRQMLAMDVAADLDVDWPGQLAAHLRALGGEYAWSYNFVHPSEPMVRDDRVMAHLVLDDLVTNAAKSGAMNCDIALERTGSGFVARVIDDGKPIPPEQWMREGGGLHRLSLSLKRRGGGISYERLDEGRKQVVAQWNSTPVGAGDVLNQ